MQKGPREEATVRGMEEQGGAFSELIEGKVGREEQGEGEKFSSFLNSSKGRERQGGETSKWVTVLALFRSLN